MHRERALELLRQGRRVRPPGFSIILRQATVLDDVGGEFVDDNGVSWNASEWDCAYEQDGWRLIKERTPRAELRAALAKETERRECVERCMAQLQTELAEAEERAKVAEVENARLRGSTYGSRFGAASLDADMRRSRDVAAADRDRLAAEVATLTAECERLRAAAPRFAVGQRVSDVYGNEGTVASTQGSYVKFKSGPAWCEDAHLHPAPDAKPAEPVWHPCSAAEAREKHAAGMRVKWRGWSADVWIIHGECLDRMGGGGDQLHAIRILLNASGDGWLWSDPLPETEGGAE